MQAEMSRHVYAFEDPPSDDREELTRLLGGKGANLVVMRHDLGLPVPPGFTISTDACLQYLQGRWPAGLDDELREGMDELAARAGRRFGDAADPLLVSVRSGAPVSMPGMLDTILDLGLNDETAEGLGRAVGDPAFARDCLRRFRENYRAVIGSDDVPDDPWLQLRSAIEAVFRSWNSDRARAYRRREGISDQIGTAVTVQAMVFGNRGGDSGTGVLFTRNPSTGEPALYGDVMFDAQGEDVVAGGHATQPIEALEQRLPDVAAELRDHATLLERHYADLCDIEFTIEQGRLWMLQVRVGKRTPRAALRAAIDMAEDAAFPLSREEAVRRVSHLLADPPRVFVRAAGAPAPIATGLPASPGVATGEIVTSSDAAEAAAAAGHRVILVRSETSPEDVRGMAVSAGILTARGGLASHAAVVARGWGIPAVVGARGVELADHGVIVGGRTLRAGEEITIDGSSGEVHAGTLAGEWEVVPEAATLLGWADELGIQLGGDAAEPAPAASGPVDGTDGAHSGRQLEGGDLLRALLIRGSASTDQLGEGLTTDAATIDRLVGGLLAEGLVERASGTLRLSSNGRLRALELFAADRSAVGSDRAPALLEEFGALDGRVKEVVTAWQVRDVGGEQALNDHADADYDAGVLDELAGVHRDAAIWLAPLGATLPRFAAYRARLAHAVELARGGDQRFVASPRVDSYHSVWFELHEDLIRLAGRRRSEEAM